MTGVGVGTGAIQVLFLLDKIKRLRAEIEQLQTEKKHERMQTRDEVERIVREALQPFVGKLNTPETREQIVDALLRITENAQCQHPKTPPQSE